MKCGSAGLASFWAKIICSLDAHGMHVRTDGAWPLQEPLCWRILSVRCSPDTLSCSLRGVQGTAVLEMEMQSDHGEIICVTNMAHFKLRDKSHHRGARGKGGAWAVGRRSRRYPCSAHVPSRCTQGQGVLCGQTGGSSVSEPVLEPHPGTRHGLGGRP